MICVWISVQKILFRKQEIVPNLWSFGESSSDLLWKYQKYIKNISKISYILLEIKLKEYFKWKVFYEKLILRVFYCFCLNFETKIRDYLIGFWSKTRIYWKINWNQKRKYISEKMSLNWSQSFLFTKSIER